MSNRIEELREISKGIKNIEEATIILNLVRERDDDNIGIKRTSLYPLKHREKYERSLHMVANTWSASTIDFLSCLNDFHSFPHDLRQPLLMTFAFFSNLDGVAADIISENLLSLAHSFEEAAFYRNQVANEIVHSETYTNMITDLVEDEEERLKIYRSIVDFKHIREINEWIKRQIYMCQGRKRLYITMVFLELNMFTSFFCIIFWYKHKFPGKLIQVIESNEYISRDESLHGLNGIYNYNELPDDEKFQSDEEIYEIFRSGMEVMETFVREDVFKDIKLEGLSADLVVQYTQFISDITLKLLNCKPIYNVKNPFPWMEMHELEGKTNFFEKQTTDYSKFDISRAVNLIQRRNGLLPIRGDEREEEEGDLNTFNF